MSRRIGLFGGTFNPIHHGHLRLARAIRRRAGLDEVWLLVTPQNPWKEQHTLLADDIRLQMVRAATRRCRHLVASDYEFHLPRPSYTWNTLQALSVDYPDVEFVLLVGGDNWQRFPQWFRHEDILEHYHIVVYPRSGSDVDMTSLPANVQVVEAPLMDVSSTQIRQLVHDGLPYRHLVPAAVADIISRRRLYL